MKTFIPLKIFSGLIVFAFFVAALGCSQEPKLSQGTLSIGPHRFEVEIAATPASRQRGLMYRQELGDQQGMLFAFPDEQVRSFWMKNTSLPLTIAYIDKHGIIQTIRDLEPYSTTSVSSEVPVQYALEVNRGVLDRLGITMGDEVILPDFKDITVF